MLLLGLRESEYFVLRFLSPLRSEMRYVAQICHVPPVSCPCKSRAVQDYGSLVIELFIGKQGMGYLAFSPYKGSIRAKCCRTAAIRKLRGPL